MPRNYNSPTTVFVNMAIGATTIKYGFLSRLGDSYQNDLGQVKISTLTDVTGLVFKANYPKPPRATKEVLSGTVSGFISSGSIATAKAAGWKIKPGKGRGGIGATTKYVVINGVKYAWNFTPLPAGVLSPDLTTADIKTAEASDVVVFGASFPKPPRMKVEITGEGGASTGSYFSTFVDPAKVDELKDEGWLTSGKSKLTKADLEMMAQL